jgi:hypothetical protein
LRERGLVGNLCWRNREGGSVGVEGLDDAVREVFLMQAAAELAELLVVDGDNEVVLGLGVGGDAR